MLKLLIATLIFLHGYIIVFVGAAIRVPVGPKKTPIGVIIKPGEEVELEAIRLSFWLKDRLLEIRPQFEIELFPEVVEEGNAVLLDRAVCRLLTNGVQAIIATSSLYSAQMLLEYSSNYNLPVISPSILEATTFSSQSFFRIEPSTTRAVVDLIRYYGWEDIVYIYDSDDGPEKLQRIFHLGYRSLKIGLTGILRVNKPEDAKSYLRQLDFTKKNSSFHVILDVKPELARDIIVRHVHDGHVGKTNFHFLVSKLVLGEFWDDKRNEMGSVNVTGFRLPVSENQAAKHYLKYLHDSLHEAYNARQIPISAYYSYDASLALSEGLQKVFRKYVVWRTQPSSVTKNTTRNCLVSEVIDNGLELLASLKEIQVTSGITGSIQFTSEGERKNYTIEIIEAHSPGNRLVAKWTDVNGLKTFPSLPFPSSSARVDNKRLLKITSLLHTPFLLVDPSSNNTASPQGKRLYAGFLKDLIDMLAKEMNFEYEIRPAPDGQYGMYNEGTGQWSGMIGEVIRGDADLAVADMNISPKRQRVVDFSEPIMMVSLSLLMKNPASVTFSSPYFIFNAFSGNVWICILFALIIVACLLFVIGKFTGSPDSIESASGLWGKKFTPVNSVWFTSGSMLLQSTGIYPRSVSSRILTAAWWCFALILLALFIANITCQMHIDRLDTEESPQLSKLKSLSSESIIKESVIRGWPDIGLVRGGSTERFVRMSNLSTYKDYVKVLDSHPELAASNVNEGIARVRRSKGYYCFLMESTRSEYVSNQEPCDTIQIHDASTYTGYGIAVPKGSPMKNELNEALRTIRERGEMGSLHRKWWIEGSPCLEKDFLRPAKDDSLGLRSTSGIFYVILICIGLTAIVAVAQYFWRQQRKDERKRKLSFEDMTLGQPGLPLPPPELLTDSTPVEDGDSEVIDGWSEHRLLPTSHGEPSP